MKPLEGQVAVVAGATRGAGRGIARVLGEAGATVYCSGRSSRSQAEHHRPPLRRPSRNHRGDGGACDGRGRRGIRGPRRSHGRRRRSRRCSRASSGSRSAWTCSSTSSPGKPVASWKSFWNLPLDESRAFVDGWLWPHVVTCWHAAPLMVARKSGLMVEIIEQEGIGYHGQFFFDLMEISLKRLSYGMAQDLAPKGVTALAITPGFMRTEAILEGFGVTEANWREAAENNPEAKKWGFIASETPCFVGRAVAALAADPQREDEERRRLQLRRALGGIRLHRRRRQPPEHVSLHERALSAAGERQAADGGGVEDRCSGTCGNELTSLSNLRQQAKKPRRSRRARRSRPSWPPNLLPRISASPVGRAAARPPPDRAQPRGSPPARRSASDRLRPLLRRRPGALRARRLVSARR